MLRVLMLLAEYERELIVARTRNTLGRHKKEIKEKGFFVSKDGKRVNKLGRPRGKKDKGKRRKSGYYRRWDNEKHKKTTPKTLTGD